jgi:hypothetical protein
VFRNETAGRVLKGAALAAGLAAMGFASQALATEANPTGPQIELTSSSMVKTYAAYVGTSAGTAVDAYSNGVTFNYLNWNPVTHVPTSPTVYTLFGFCVDITHDMTLGSLPNYIYDDNFGVIADPLPTDFHGNAISPTQLSSLNNLIDTGWLLHESQAGQSSAYVNNVNLQLAAIQAAIWKVEGGYVNINGGSSSAGANVGGAVTVAPGHTETYADYFNAYSTGAYHSLADGNDRFYTIVQDNPYDRHQSFAVGWTLPGVPEPTTWAMMLTGFFGMGAMLRNRRKLVRVAI